MPNQMDGATIKALRCCCEGGLGCNECPFPQASKECLELDAAAAERLEALGREVEELRDRIGELVSERDEAISDLRKDCTTCRYKGHSGLSEPCRNCQGCGYISWVWRGPCDENGGKA